VDTNGSGGPAGLVAVDAVNMDDPLFAVYLGDLALSTLELATNNQNLIILADR
jgi:hypothetical protein